MNHWVLGYRLLAVIGVALLWLPTTVFATDVDEARQALAKQEDDEDSTQQLEEVFRATERRYTLIRQGHHSLNYSFDYAFSSDQRLDLEIQDDSIRNADVAPEATHNFTNTFNYDYGLLNNLTLGIRVPLVTKFDTEENLSVYDVGDLAITTRWQPRPHRPGRASLTLFSTLTSKTGVSPFEIDVDRQLSTGSGYYSVSLGVSLSRVLDPVVLFGSFSGTHNFKEAGLNQVRGGRVLEQVEPGIGVSGSGGFAYSLSYDISLSLSAQFSYNDETQLNFRDGSSARARDQMAGIVNFSLGTRVSDNTIVNTSVGFGLTHAAPDFSVGISLPINISGLSGS
ncbi:MAG: transporter [Oleiphilaceae bacterium]|nr:transporter [Oleiphilaceae bacterium]